MGGGFARRETRENPHKRLSKDRAEFVLFSRENNMVFYPLAGRSGRRAINPSGVTVPLRQMLPGVRCRTEEVRNIDLASSEVEYRTIRWPSGSRDV